MKIKKLVEAKKLIESEEELTDVNPQEVSTNELVDIVKDEVEEVTDGDQEITDVDALKVATEIKNTSIDTSAGQIVIGAEDYEDTIIKNRLTKALDASYATSRKGFRRGKRHNANVLVEGLPGSGKTAIVEAWCNSRGLTLVPVNATDPKLETSINGMPLRDVRVTDDNKVARVRDDVLDNLLNNLHPELAGKCVLFVDEFNRQKQDQLRRPLMSLFNEKRNSDGSVDVSKNLLFSVICINPSGLKFKDKGTVDLNDAEHNRFLHTLRGYDSNPEEALRFFYGWHIKELLNLGIIPPNSTASKNHGGHVGPTRPLTEDELEDAKEYIRIYDLADKILNPERNDGLFSFSNRDELDELDQGLGLRKQLLTARLLTDLLNAAGGEIKEFLDLVDYSSDLLDTRIEMFHTILDDYEVDYNELYAKYKLEEPVEKEKEEDVEDDEDLFGGATTSSKKTFKGMEAEQAIRDIVDKYF